MMRGYIIVAIIIVVSVWWACYISGELSQMKDNLKVIDLYYEMVENYEKRIKLMEDFIGYNEDVVNNARGMTAKKWMEHIWNKYVRWDDDYEEGDDWDLDYFNRRDD